MAPTTFDELVAHQKEISAGLQKDHGVNKAFSDKVVEKFGVDWGEDLEGLRWRAQCVERFDELSREIVEKDAEVRREKEVTAEIRRTRARNMAEYEEIMKLLGDTVAEDPGLIKRLQDIVRTYSCADVEVVGETPEMRQGAQAELIHNGTVGQDGELMEIMEEAVRTDPWMLKGVQDIIRAYCESPGGAWLVERESLLQTISARDGRVGSLEREVINLKAVVEGLKVDLRWGSCPLVGLSPREVIAEGGTLLSVALEEWERSQVAGEGKSLAECVRGAGRVIPTMDGGWICGHGDSLLVIGREVVVIPFEDYRFYDEAFEWVTLEYGKPRVVFRIANGETKPMDEMFPAAMARYATEPIE